MIFEVIFDLETKKFFDEITTNDPADLGVSIVSIYERELDDNLNEVRGNVKSFWEDEIESMWSIFQKANRIIGFNSLHFDVPALKPYTNFAFEKLPHFDVMAQVKQAFGRRISLDSIAKDTLGTQKIDHGSKAVYYWQNPTEENLTKLKKYCEMDAVITKDVYDFVLKNNYLQFKDKWNTLRKVELDFSYPEEKQEAQASLF